MFLIIQPSSWENIRHIASFMVGKWVFRGQSNEEWGLSSSLERALGQIDSNERRVMAEEKESLVSREFRRRAHHYIASPPSEEYNLEWLALIQHHGGATRLLDFSHSFYVGAFFAVEENVPESDSAAIWAINLAKVNDAIAGKLDAEHSQIIRDNSNQEHVLLAQELLREGIDSNLVFGVEPERMNERMAIQQGIFMFPCNIGATFEENLAGVFDSTPDVFQKTPAFTFNPEVHVPELLEALFAAVTVVKVIVPRYLREEMLRELWSMNVSTATLFPGIDGFARSLNYHLL